MYDHSLRMRNFGLFSKNKSAKFCLLCPKTCEIAIASRTHEKRLHAHRTHILKVILQACVRVRIYFRNSQFAIYLCTYIKVYFLNEAKL